MSTVVLEPSQKSTQESGVSEQYAKDVLHDVFGYTQYRGEQRQIIDHVCAGGDALVLMPTGGGKIGRAHV